jgi:hypothetical protein
MLLHLNKNRKLFKKNILYIYIRGYLGMIQWNYIQPIFNRGLSSLHLPTFTSVNAPLFQYMPFGSITTKAYNPVVSPVAQGMSSFANPFGSWFNFSLPTFSHFKLPTFNYANIWNNFKIGVSSLYNSAKSGILSIGRSAIRYTGKLADYCAEKGRRLAQAALNGAPGRFLKRCATYVKKAIVNAGLGSYKQGVHGYGMADAYKATGNFREISAEGVDLKKLPAGCILCYGKGVAGYNGQYGLTEITLGNGKAVSDGITRNIRPGARILIPV